MIKYGMCSNVSGWRPVQETDGKVMNFTASSKVGNFYSDFLIHGSINFYINKIQQDATVCRYLFTAKLLYMFRASIAPIIRSTSNCNCSFWYRS